MTEEEAKTKWCPHVRYPNLMLGGQVASNIYSDGCNVNSDGNRTPPAFCCVASDCMMWEIVVSVDEGKEGNYPDDGRCGLTK